MMRTDDAVQASWEAVSATLLSASWAWHPGEPKDPLSVKLADEANRMMGVGGRSGRMRRAWEDQLAELILHEFIGYRYAEPVWEFRRGHGYDLVDLADRDPRAHRQWVTDRGQLLGVVQDPINEDGRFYNASAAPKIPASNLLLLSRGRTGQNYEGRGLARAAYFVWTLKTHVLDMISVAAERWGFATPMLRGRRSEAKSAGIADNDFDTQLDAVRSNLEDYFAQ